MRKTKKQILSQSWLNKKDISILLGTDHYHSCEVFNAAKKLENDMLDLYPKKVRMTCVLEALNLQLDILRKQVEI